MSHSVHCQTSAPWKMLALLLGPESWCMSRVGSVQNHIWPQFLGYLHLVYWKNLIAFCKNFGVTISKIQTGLWPKIWRCINFGFHSKFNHVPRALNPDLFRWPLVVYLWSFGDMVKCWSIYPKMSTPSYFEHDFSLDFGNRCSKILKVAYYTGPTVEHKCVIDPTCDSFALITGAWSDLMCLLSSASFKQWKLQKGHLRYSFLTGLNVLDWGGIVVPLETKRLLCVPYLFLQDILNRRQTQKVIFRRTPKYVPGISLSKPPIKDQIITNNDKWNDRKRQIRNIFKTSQTTGMCIFCTKALLERHVSIQEHYVYSGS